MPRPIPIQVARRAVVRGHVRIGRPVRAHTRRVVFVRWDQQAVGHSTDYVIFDKDSGDNVGWVSFAQEPEKMIVSELEINDRHMGKGFGTAAMRELEEIARRNHERSILLLMPTFEGKRLYSKMGYRTSRLRDMQKAI